MDNDALLWLTQPMLILFSLGVFVVILHALFVYGHPLSEAGWRRADYIWLTGAVLSLLGMSAEARQQWIELRKPISEQLYLGSVDYLRDSFLVLRIFPCHVEIGRTGPPGTAAQYEAYCHWLAETEQVMDRLFRSRSKIDPTLFVGHSAFSGLPVAAETITRLAKISAEYNRTLDELNHWASLDASGTERLVKIVSPILLSFALALRITKVTGQIRNQERGTNAPGTPDQPIARSGRKRSGSHRSSG